MKYLLAVLLLAVSLTGALAEEPKDVTANYINRDFSSLLMPKSPFLGFIGPNFQRLRIHFDTVVRDNAHPAVYRVTGHSLVKDNACDFEGTITVSKLMATGKDSFTDENNKVLVINAEGKFSAKYEFRENAAQPHSGVFSGTMDLDWYLDGSGGLKYDDIDVVSDGYANNQYTGTWAPYGDLAKKKTANWGEFRIPESGDLDRGAGEFSPSEKYYGNGWAGYDQEPGHKWSP